MRRFVQFKNRKTPLPLVFRFLSCLCKFSEILSDASLRKFYINLRSQWDYVHINLDCVAFTMNYWVCKLLWIIYRNCPNFLGHWAIGSDSTKFPHQVIRSNYSVLCRGIYVHMSKIAGNLEWSLIKAGQVWYLQCKVFDVKFDIWEIRGKLQIWSHLLKKSLMKNFIFCAVLTLRKLRRWLAQKSFC